MIFIGQAGTTGNHLFREIIELFAIGRPEEEIETEIKKVRKVMHNTENKACRGEHRVTPVLVLS